MNEVTNGGNSPQTMNVYQAIAWVQGQLAHKGIGKDKQNTQQKYKFRGIDDIYNALAPLLSEAGLCILPRVMKRDVTEQSSRQGGKLFYVVLDMEFDLVSASDGSMHTIKTCGEAMDSGDKATNKAMSAAYKYACLQAFCIPTQGDNDADATTHEVATYTPEQFRQFHQIVNDGDALAYVGFMHGLSPNVQTELYNSFEQGKKVEGKKKCDMLESTGIDLVTQYVDKLREASAQTDYDGIRENVAELEGPVKEMVWKQLDSETRQIIREAVKEAA